jgi:hypothetical protein
LFLIGRNVDTANVADVRKEVVDTAKQIQEKVVQVEAETRKMAAAESPPPLTAVEEPIVPKIDTPNVAGSPVQEVPVPEAEKPLSSENVDVPAKEDQPKTTVKVETEQVRTDNP